MIENKKWYKSKTIQSAIVLILVLIKDQLDVNISEAEVESILFWITEVLAIIGVIYGRFRAEKPIL